MKNVPMVQKQILLRSASLGVALLTMALLVGCSEDSEQSGSANGGTNASMVIEPNVHVGQVHGGMTVPQVIAELGEPHRKTETALEYKRLGLAVVPDTNGVVQVIMCGDVTGNEGPYVKTFKGRTKEGIGMNSTRQELVAAYGEPDSSERFPMGTESMRYDRLGITFTLGGGKVYHMIVRLPTNQETNHTIKLEPAPR